MKKLERVQRKWTRAFSGMSDLPYDERLRRLDLYSNSNLSSIKHIAGRFHGKTFQHSFSAGCTFS